MTNRRLWLALAWLTAAAGVTAIAWAGAVPIGISMAPSADGSTVRRQAVRRPSASDSLASATVARDPFRVDRRAAAIAYDPQRLMVNTVPAVPKPGLLLVGIVLGVRPAAVIEGFPGVEGSRVVRERDEVAGLRVRRIEADRVVIVGMDTTWVLKVREPWN